jgi:hypothetical protein
LRALLWWEHADVSLIALLARPNKDNDMLCTQSFTNCFAIIFNISSEEKKIRGRLIWFAEKQKKAHTLTHVLHNYYRKLKRNSSFFGKLPVWSWHKKVFSNSNFVRFDSV